MARFNTKFKVGDRVKFTGKPGLCDSPPDPTKVYTVKEVPSIFDGVYLKEHNQFMWYCAELFTLAEPDPRAVPGVPEGYRLVRIGTPKEGDFYPTRSGAVTKANMDYRDGVYPIFEKTTKTERLWVWVDKSDGGCCFHWFTDGVSHSVSGPQIIEVPTEKTREVPA